MSCFGGLGVQGVAFTGLGFRGAGNLERLGCKKGFLF